MNVSDFSLSQNWYSILHNFSQVGWKYVQHLAFLAPFLLNFIYQKCPSKRWLEFNTEFVRLTYTRMIWLLLGIMFSLLSIILCVPQCMIEYAILEFRLVVCWIVCQLFHGIFELSMAWVCHDNRSMLLRCILASTKGYIVVYGKVRKCVFWYWVFVEYKYGTRQYFGHW